MTTILAEGGKDWTMWCKIGDGLFTSTDIGIPTASFPSILYPGNATSEDIETLLQDYGAVLDYPASIYGAELYSTYPDAKYILVSYCYIEICVLIAHCGIRPPEIL